MADSTSRTKISTLIFMDLETTGLPFDVGKKNVHITEMSFVAIDRNSFENDQNLRALNKLSLCVCPRSVVSPGAMSITGLYNDVLEHQAEFDDSVPKLLEYFFRRLELPICLLAHNGKRFDFPVLQAELKRINYALDSNILCADTLVAIRSICLTPKPITNLLPSNDNSLDEDEIDILLSEDLEIFASMTSLHEEINATSEPISEKELLDPKQNEKTPTNRKIPQDLKIFDSMTTLHEDINGKPEPISDKEYLDPKQNEKTPTNQKIPQDLKPNHKKRKILDPPFVLNKKVSKPIRRALFPESAPSTYNITKFTLENLYLHFFKESPPKSHYAEADCIALSKVCQKMNKDFLQWIDENSEVFSNIEALW